MTQAMFDPKAEACFYGQTTDYSLNSKKKAPYITKAEQDG